MPDAHTKRKESAKRPPASADSGKSAGLKEQTPA
jgi:hypothetical protein